MRCPALLLLLLVASERSERASDMSRGRFAASAEGHKNGITLLVPRPVVDAEQDALMGHLTSAKVQNLIVFLRRGGLRHLDVDERIRKGDYKGYCPLHVAVLSNQQVRDEPLEKLKAVSQMVFCVLPVEVANTHRGGFPGWRRFACCAGRRLA